MQPSTQLLSGLSPTDISRIQHTLLAEIRSERPGSEDPTTILARTTEALRQSDTGETSDELLKHLTMYSEEALALVLHDLENEKLPREEKRRRRAQKATYYRQRQIERMSSP